MYAQKELLKGYENRALVHYENIAKSDLVPYDRLGELTVNGVLKCNRYVDGKLMQLYSEKENHVGIVAATRLGKTTSYVIPTILSFAKQKTKRSMIISDPKGELYRITSKTLQKEGYKIRLLNFRDYNHSEYWNPLTPIFRKYRAAQSIYNEVITVNDGENLVESFRGVVYYDIEDLNDAVEMAMTMALEEVGDDIDKIAMLIMPTLSERDPYWENSAREVLKAYLWAMLEDSDKTKNPITEDTFSFSTIISLLRYTSVGSGRTYEDHGFFSERPKASRAREMIEAVLINNGSQTSGCIMSTFHTGISIFRDCAMRLITSCNSFQMEDLVDGPTAVFIDYCDELKVHYQIISLFVRDAYRFLIAEANKREEGKLETPFYFILDEFGNFPKISDFETTVSACGGRNIFFMLIVQSYAQLNAVYGRAVAEIIRDNLNMHVFLGSNNPDTLRAFSEECGRRTRISPMSALNGSGERMENYHLETVSVMPQSELSHLKAGECVVTEANTECVLFSELVRYYELDEMNHLPTASMLDYVSAVNPFDKRFRYKCD